MTLKTIGIETKTQVCQVQGLHLITAVSSHPKYYKLEALRTCSIYNVSTFLPKLSKIEISAKMVYTKIENGKKKNSPIGLQFYKTR